MDFSGGIDAGKKSVFFVFAFYMEQRRLEIKRYHVKFGWNRGICLDERVHNKGESFKIAVWVGIFYCNFYYPFKSMAPWSVSEATTVHTEHHPLFYRGVNLSFRSIAHNGFVPALWKQTQCVADKITSLQKHSLFDLNLRVVQRDSKHVQSHWHPKKMVILSNNWSFSYC